MSKWFDMRIDFLTARKIILYAFVLAITTLNVEAQQPLEGDGGGLCPAVGCSWTGCSGCGSNCYSCEEIENECGYTCEDARQRLEQAGEVCTPFTPTPTVTPTPTPRGGWYNAYRENCPTFCEQLGLENIASPDGYKCTSGEERPWSAIHANIDYSPTGCWHPCDKPEGREGAASVWQRCYHPTQKRDNDRTDWTVGCYCG